MAANLLNLSTGHVSLEYDATDHPAVKAAIRSLYGEPFTEDHPGYSTLSFGGATFTFCDDWGDFCLIAGDGDGDAILMALIECLNGER